MTAISQIVVVGAGYAGVAAANQLVRRGADSVAVTIVNPSDRFVERIRLHQHAANGYDATQPLAPLLRPGVGLRIARAEQIADGTVVLDDGAVRFDRCVLAVGAVPVGGRGGHAVGDLAGAEALKHRLNALRAGATVAVVGGGLTGIETVAEIAEAHPDLAVGLVARGVAACLPSRARRHVDGVLDRLGIVVLSELPADVDCVVWATGDRAPTLATRSGLPVDELGRVLTDEALVSLGDPRIVATGDAAAPPARLAGGLRPSCQAAVPLGLRAADTVLAQLRGQRPTPADVRFVGQAVALGRSDGLVQPSDRHDVPHGPALTGRPAAWIKERVCRGTVTRMRWQAGRSTTGEPQSEPETNDARR